MNKQYSYKKLLRACFGLFQKNKLRRVKLKGKLERQILEDLCKMFKKDRTGMKAFGDKLLITDMAKGFTKF